MKKYQLKLIKPDVKYKDQVIDVISEVKKDSDPFGTGKWYLDIDINRFDEFVQTKINEEDGKSLPEGYVSSSTYWAIDENDRYIGRITLRHALTENLMITGGHIGYDIRPSKRNKGYASEMLSLCLVEAKKIGLDKVLLTTYDYHSASRKVMENNGAILQDYVANGDKSNARYWIHL